MGKTSCLGLQGLGPRLGYVTILCMTQGLIPPQCSPWEALPASLSSFHCTVFSCWAIQYLFIFLVWFSHLSGGWFRKNTATIHFRKQKLIANNKLKFAITNHCFPLPQMKWTHFSSVVMLNCSRTSRKNFVSMTFALSFHTGKTIILSWGILRMKWGIHCECITWSPHAQMWRMKT